MADSPSYDAQGCLCCGGLVETHIHLDKSRIIDRCTPEPSRDNPNHMKRVAAVKAGFTVEDIYNRAKATLENCIKQGTTRIRTHAEIDMPVGTKCIEALKMLQKEYAWAVDLEICAFAQEGLATCAGGRQGAGRGAGDGRHLDRRRAELRHRPSRPHQPRVRAGARVRHPRRSAHRFGPRPGDDGQHAGRRLDREIQIRRPRRDGPHDQGRGAAARQAEGHRQAAGRRRRGGDGAAGDRPVRAGAAQGLRRAALHHRRQPVRGDMAATARSRPTTSSIRSRRSAIARWCGWPTCTPTCCRSATTTG